MASSGVLPYSQGRPPANFPGPIKPSKPFPGFAGAFVAGQAKNGAAWAQKLQKSPWATGKDNTAAGWQAAGYGNPATNPATAPHNSATTQTPPNNGASPLDATFWANVYGNTFKATNSVNDLNRQNAYSDVDLQNALGKLSYQQPRDQLKAEQAANARGALYSTPYDQQAGDITHSYDEQKGALQMQNTRGHETRNAQIDAILGGVPIYNAQQAAEAASRASQQAANNPALGEPAPPSGTPGGGKSGGKSGGGSKSKLVNKIAGHGKANTSGELKPHIPKTPASVKKNVPNQFGSRYTRGERHGGGKSTMGIKSFGSTKASR